MVISVIRIDHFCDLPSLTGCFPVVGHAEPHHPIPSLTQHPLAPAVFQCLGCMQGAKEITHSLLLKSSILESHGQHCPATLSWPRLPGTRVTLLLRALSALMALPSHMPLSVCPMPCLALWPERSLYSLWPGLGTESRGQDAIALAWHTSPEQVCEYEEIQLLAAGTGMHNVSITVLRDLRIYVRKDLLVSDTGLVTGWTAQVLKTQS